MKLTSPVPSTTNFEAIARLHRERPLVAEFLDRRFADLYAAALAALPKETPPC